MTTVKARARAIRKQAGRNTNVKANTVTVNRDDFWLILNHVVRAEQYNLDEKNLELLIHVKKYRGLLREIAEADTKFTELINAALNWREVPVVEEVV
jgi:hypothetical protein